MSTGIKETYRFQAEIAQLMTLMINTFYSNREIFLRELISNASDALDKLRYEALAKHVTFSPSEELCIQLLPDKKGGRLVIVDNGVGMTKHQLITNLGTIAKSGTKEFMEALQAGADISMIGQFGVGFYASFIVADRVTVTTKHNDDRQYIWDSMAGGSFTVRPDNTDPLKRGTRVMLQLKGDMRVLLEEYALRAIVKKHSQFIGYPIKLLVTRQRCVEESDSDEEEVSTDMGAGGDADDNEDDDDASAAEEEDESSEDERETYTEFVVLNTIRPLWMRQPDEITHEEYAEFYRSISNDWEDHRAVRHLVVEGQLQFRALLYVPHRAPPGLYESLRRRSGIKLYVRRVFITDQSNDLIPQWLRFIKGVVDSEDLPLSISRESLQHNNVMRVITKNLVKKSLEMLEELAEQSGDAYLHFYAQFSRNVKLGVHEDALHRSRLAELLRFRTTASGEGLCSLADYVSRMQSQQRHIYLITGESIRQVEDAPQLERVKALHLEVIYMIEPIDEYVLLELTEFRGHALVSLNREKVELPDDEETLQRHEWNKLQYGRLCRTAHVVLESRAERVLISRRLVESPCCVVASFEGWTAHMERIMRAQALHNHEENPSMMSERLFELNAEHPIIQRLMHMTKHPACHRILCDMIELLFETALVASGYDLPGPELYVSHVDRMVKMCLGLDWVAEAIQCAGDAPMGLKDIDDSIHLVEDDID